MSNRQRYGCPPSLSGESELPELQKWCPYRIFLSGMRFEVDQGSLVPQEVDRVAKGGYST